MDLLKAIFFIILGIAILYFKFVLNIRNDALMKEKKEKQKRSGFVEK
jgi:hypothetical protein